MFAGNFYSVESGKTGVKVRLIAKLSGFMRREERGTESGKRKVECGQIVCFVGHCKEVIRNVTAAAGKRSEQTKSV